jgi:4-nitrophenyl phosphatase
VVIGKPSSLILEEAARLVGFSPAECLFVGDNLASDIGAAQAAGMPSLLVQTGITSPADLAGSAVRPDYTLPSVADLPALLQEAPAES